MEISISKQLTALAAALALGFLLGFVYDALRPIRRNGGRTAAAVIDIFFALISGMGLFLFAMEAGSGKLGIWELTASFLGFLVYTYTLSDFVFRLFGSFYALFGAAFKKVTELSRNILKKTFKKPMK